MGEKVPYFKRDGEPEPVEDCQTIYKFIPENYYEELLEKGALCFRSLTAFDDKLEGTQTPLEKIVTKCSIEERAEKRHLSETQKREDFYIAEFWRERQRQFTFADCWHIYESPNAWNIFKHPIAIQSTFYRLKNSITDKRDVRIEKIPYKDMKNDLSDKVNLIDRYAFRKNLSFFEENELRAILFEGEKLAGFGSSINKDREWVSVDLNALIETVFVRSSADQLFLESIQELTSKKLPKVEVRKA